MRNVELPGVGPCRTYRSGHQPHWIMARQYRSRGRWATVVGFDGDHVLIECRDGSLLRWWHHHPWRLRAAVGAHGPAVKIVRAGTVLQCAGLWFPCSSDGPTPCLLEPPGATEPVSALVDPGATELQLATLDGVAVTPWWA